MSEHQAKFHSFKYCGGKKVTVSTWHQRDLTPYEVAIRLHLHTGASIRYMLFGEGEPFPTKSDAVIRDDTDFYQYLDKYRQAKKLFDVDVFDLKNGQINRIATYEMDNTLMQENNITNLMAIKENDVIRFINKEIQTATNGVYLLKIDGLFH